MGETFYQLWNEVIGELGTDLPPARAQKIVNEAWQNILNRRPWSFLLAEGILQAPAQILGTATFTQFSTAVTADAALTLLLDAVTQPPVTRRAIRLYSSSGGVNGQSRIHQIYAYSPGGSITLDQPWQSASGDYSIVIYRQYFLPPLNKVVGTDYQENADFARFLTVKDQAMNFQLLLNKNIYEINRVDPNRVSVGTPQCLIQAPAGSVSYPGVSFDGSLLPGLPLFELWPNYIGTTDRTYLCLYQRRGLPLTDDLGSVDSVLPYQIDPELVRCGSRLRAYRWAETNKGRYPYLQKTDWRGLMVDARAEWNDLFLDMRRMDEEIYQQNWLPRWGEQASWDASGSYAQTHDVPLMAAYGLYIG